MLNDKTQWQMLDDKLHGKCSMTNGQWQMVNGKSSMTNSMANAQSQMLNDKLNAKCA
jgi:hypothetical protein